MDKEDFIEFIKSNILVLFTGSEIAGEEKSSFRDACVALGPSGSVLVKFKKSDDYRIVIKRIQPFKPFEIALMKSVIAEMSKIYANKLTQEYQKQIEHIITEKAICKSITAHHTTMQQLLSLLSDWGMRTYEGNKTRFGFIINNHKSKEQNENLNILNFLYKDFSALLSDGVNTFMEISADGYLEGYLNASKTINENLLVPFEYLKMASLCTGGKIGVCLLRDGDILIFKNKELVFAKRSGNWVCYSHDVIIGELGDKNDNFEDVRKAIYLAALDTSFNKCGGCMVHISANDKFGVLKHLNAIDVLTEECYDKIVEDNRSKSMFSVISGASEQVRYSEFLKEERCSKSANLRQIIKNRKFQELSRKLRLELVNIDGATIIGNDGTIIAAGAIIKIEAGSTGGGRLAAAKMLSNYGISIKISNDGSIEGFKTDRSKLRAKPLFIIG